MSEKRFAMAYGGNVIEDKLEKKTYQTSSVKEDVESVVDLLNAFSEENEQLNANHAFIAKKCANTMLELESYKDMVADLLIDHQKEFHESFVIDVQNLLNIELPWWFENDD